MGKLGPNERCPCGSGKKFKKCCQSRGVSDRYTREERDSAGAKLAAFIAAELGPADDEAFEEFWGRFADHPGELDDHLDEMSEHVCDLWFAFDRPLEDGRFVVDRFLDQEALDLSGGEKLYLQVLRVSSMRLYEIEDSRPGESLTLRDLIGGDCVTVQERLGSRSLARFDWIAARVVSRGASGKPEIEGLFQIPDFHHQGTREQLRAERDSYLQVHPGANVESFYKTMPPFFHDVWVGSILEPFVPKLVNTDGEETVITRVSFEVLDAPALKEALDKAEGLRREESEGDRWHWSGKNVKDKPIDLGLIELREGTLALEANSVVRGERGRALVEAAAGTAVRRRVTTHEDLQRRVREGLRAGETSAPAPDKDAIPPEVQEALVLNHYARHYRGWLDESIPALDDRTPRAAAKSEALRPKLIDLLHELDRMYQRSLKLRMPAYDPSWMWAELGLEEEAARHPPPLAHERVSQLVPGSGELCRSIAEAMRRRPGFKETSTVFTETDAGSNLEPQRFLREHQPPDGSPALAPYLDLMVNFELHRRKAFWVDESLALMLAYTELDALGRELRVPFPSFALVLTDRNALSLGERLLAREQGCPLAGHYLRVATVFVTEQRTGDERTLQVCFAFDALGADLPHLVHHSIPMNEDRPVESYLESLSPRLEIEPAVPDTNPVRGLLQVTLNAILYATSAGVEPETRSGPGKADGGPRRRAGPPLSYSSEAVYFLPGAIEISHLRRMQELERIPDGRTILRRFMVRGHWRRAAPDWADQRMRWIQPYWKGPDMAAIIERTYKLKP